MIKRDWIASRREIVGQLVAAMVVLLVCCGAPATWAAITFVSVSAPSPSSSNVSSIMVSRPTSLASGDVMIALITYRGGDTISVSTVPAGWTEITSRDDGASLGMHIYRKVAGGSEPASYTWTLSSGNRAAGAILAYRGVDTTSPILTFGSQINGASTSLIAPSITTTVANTMLVAFYGVPNDQNVTIAPPGAMTERFEVSTGAGPNGLVAEAAEAAQAASGATGTRVATASASRSSIGMLVALRPGCGPTFTVTNTSNSGAGSLRQAILDANACAGTDTIAFNVSGAGCSGGVCTIAPTSTLPTVTDPAIIDGWTQPGWSSAPLIELNGTGAGAGSHGLTISAGGSTLRGFVINRFSGNGILLQTTGGNTIRGNYIGTNAAGTAANANSMSGIYVNGVGNNVIGGTTIGVRNVLSGNGGRGIWVDGAAATNNVMQGNYIGVAADGTTVIGNTQEGILINAPGNTVGGTASATGNVIAAAAGSYDGVYVQSGTGNGILGNSIRDNGGLGIDLAADGVTANNGTTSVSLANVGMDFPVFTSVSLSGTNLTVAGYVGSAANQSTFAGARVEIFVADTTSAGNGEGKTYLGFLTTNANGNFSGAFTGVSGIAAGTTRITATATDASNNTSEFGANTLVPAPIGIAKFLIGHAGYGINCRTEPITVSALDGFNGLVGTYSGVVTLTTQSGRGIWSLVAGSGTLVDSTPDDGLASYQFVPADGGQATFGLSYRAGATPIDVDAYQADDATIRDDDSEGPLAFGANGFTVTPTVLSNPPPNPIVSSVPTQTAGTGFEIYLTAYGQTPTDAECGVIETYTGAHTLLFWMDHLNPTPGVLNATVNGTGVGPTEAGALGQSLTFTSGQAIVTAKYKDVGQMRLQMKDPAGLPSVVRGATNAFVVKPAGLVVSRVETLSGAVNPGASTATGAAFVAAGSVFRVEVESRDSEGSVTPSYGTESAPEGIRLSSSSLMIPVGGRNGSAGDGSLAGATGFALTATPGRLRNDTVSFDEMGVVRLVAAVADGDYLGVGPVSSVVSSDVGRFFPARFELIAGSAITPTCGAFSYMDQPSLGVSYRIEALNAAGQRTWNYDGTLLGANAVATVSVVAEDADSGIDLGVRLSGITNAWTLGAVPINVANARFARAASPDGPFEGLSFGVRVIDPLGDSQLANANMNATTVGDCVLAGNCTSVSIGGTARMRYGRIMVKPSFGPETQELVVPVEAQYFSTGLFRLNGDDNCSSYSAAQASLSGFTGSLNLGETVVGGPALTTLLSGGSSSNAAPLLLTAPGVGNDGSVDVSLDVPAWLEFDWVGTGATNPVGTAQFGRYRGNDRIIFWRER